MVYYDRTCICRLMVDSLSQLQQMATGGVANVLYQGQSRLNTFSHPLLTYLSPIPIPRPLRHRLRLLPLQHNPLHLQRHHDIPPLQILPVNLHSIDHAPYRKPLRPSTANQRRNDPNQHHPIRHHRRQNGRMAPRHHVRALLGLLRPGSCL